jgi:hypothetical protein
VLDSGSDDNFSSDGDAAAAAVVVLDIDSDGDFSSDGDAAAAPAADDGVPLYGTLSNYYYDGKSNAFVLRGSHGKVMLWTGRRGRRWETATRGQCRRG